MHLKPDHKHNWLLYYQSFLAVGVVFLFFTRLDGYLTANELLVTSVGWMLPYFALMIPLLIPAKKYPCPAVLLWCLGYAAVAVFSFAFVLQSEFSVRALIDRVLAAIFLSVTAFLFADPRVLRLTRYAILAATAIAVLNNFYQYLIDQSIFGGLYEGRARGIYLDPNDCASALILGMILTLDLLPQKIRLLWVLIVGAGVGLTLSRGGILSWIAVLIAMHLTRSIAPKQSLFWMFGLGLLMFVGVQASSQGLGDAANYLPDTVERVAGMIDGSISEDYSAIERSGIAAKGWEMFVERPIFGYGIGSTFDYNITGFNVSTHNTYLLYLAEYGFLGILILPLAIYAVTHNASGVTRKTALHFSLFVLLIACLSHTVLTLNLFLVSFATVAAMAAVSHEPLDQVTRSSDLSQPTSRIDR